MPRIVSAPGKTCCADVGFLFDVNCLSLARYDWRYLRKAWVWTRMNQFHQLWRIHYVAQCGQCRSRYSYYCWPDFDRAGRTGKIGVWGYIGVVPLAIGLIGWRPAYLPFGFKTCKTK